MVRAGLSPGVRQRGTPAWLPPTAVLAVAGGVALLAVPEHIRPQVAWCALVGVVLTAVTTAVTARRTRSTEQARRQAEAARLRQQYAEREGAMLGRLSDQRLAASWFADELVPAAVERLRKGEPATEIEQSAVFGDHLDREFVAAQRAVLHAILDAVQGEEQVKDSSQRALVAIARRVQAIVHQLGKDLRDMQIVHGTDLELSRGLQHVEHRTALVGRIAASIAVLGDARPGRQWEKAIPLYDIVRGAMSRIVDYPRVKLHAVTEVAVVGHGAEPLIHLLAELLDNATTFSPPHAPVEVTASEVPSGIAIEVEDRGVGLTEEVKQRIDRVMAQASTGIDLAVLGDTTQLGLPVVSKVARENGIDVELRTSAYGGVRAVVLVPRRLITTVQQRTPASAGAPRAPRPAMTDEPVKKALPERDPEPVVVRRTPGGLPQRQRSLTPQPPIVSPDSRRAAAAPGGTSGGSATPRQPGLMWEMFKGDRDVAPPATRTSEQTDEGE